MVGLLCVSVAQTSFKIVKWVRLTPEGGCGCGEEVGVVGFKEVVLVNFGAGVRVVGAGRRTGLGALPAAVWCPWGGGKGGRSTTEVG